MCLHQQINLVSLHIASLPIRTISYTKIISRCQVLSPLRTDLLEIYPKTMLRVDQASVIRWQTVIENRFLLIASSSVINLSQTVKTTAHLSIIRFRLQSVQCRRPRQSMAQLATTEIIRWEGVVRGMLKRRMACTVSV